MDGGTRALAVGQLCVGGLSAAAAAAADPACLPLSLTAPRLLPCPTPAADYCTAARLWPAGFAAEWEDGKGVRFVGAITETPGGPVFRCARCGSVSRLGVAGRRWLLGGVGEA